MSNELLVEELYPEADQLFSFNLPWFEDAEEVEEVLPGYKSVAILNVEAYCYQNSLVNMRKWKRKEVAIPNKVVNIDSL